MTIRFSGLLVVLLLSVSACLPQKAALKRPSLFAAFEEFRLGPEGGVDLVWSAKGINDAESLKKALQKYDSLMLDQVWVAADRVSALKLDGQKEEEVSRHMIDAITARLGQGLKRVDTATEKTLVLSLALTNLKTSLPVLAVTRQLWTEEPGSIRVSRLVPDEHVRAGRVTVELLVSDAKTKEPLVAFVDKQFEPQTLASLFDSGEDAKIAFSLWAERLWTTLSYWNWIKSRPNMT